MNTTRPDSQLFTVRVWPDPGAETGWRGQATHVLSGETRYFREWSALTAFLAAASSLRPGAPMSTTDTPRKNEMNEEY